MVVKNIHKNDFTKDTIFGIIGICGINGNLIARIFKDKGYNVIGTDLSKKEDCTFLNSLDGYNIEIFYGSHPEEFFNKSDYIFYPPSLSKSSKLFKTINEHNIPIIEINDIFNIFKPEKPVIGVTGTNGKTTTTNLLKKIAHDYNLKTTEHNLENMQGNSDYIPALESLLNGDVAILEVGTFGNLGTIKFTTKFSRMDSGIITNITPDHLKEGKNFLNYANVKGEMIQQLQGKQLIVNSNDPTIMGLIKKYNYKGDLITFSIDSNTIKESEKQCVYGHDLKIDEIISGSGYYNCDCGLKNIKADYVAKNIDLNNNTFTLSTPKGEFNFKMNIRGMHNVFNITGAIIAGHEFLKIPFKNIIKSVSNFKGVPGRMETLNIVNGKKVIVDYAHNPAGVETVLREFKNIYDEFTLIITISSESGYSGDLKIFDFALNFAKFIIPSSKASQKIAFEKIKENPKLASKIILPDIDTNFDKKGTLGATPDDIAHGFKKAINLYPSTIIAIGEAAIKFKSVFN